MLLGSTLTYLHRDLTSAVGETGRVSVRAICRDTGQSSSMLIGAMDLQASIELPTSAVAAFSRELTRVLFANSTPYVSDFVMSEAARTDASISPAILGSEAWLVADVNSSVLSSGSTSTYSLVPREPFQELVASGLSALSPVLAASALAAKVRVFERAEGRDRFVRYAPFVLLGELTEDELASAADQAARVLGRPWTSLVATVRSLPDPRQRALATHRLLQALASLQLGVTMKQLTTPLVSDVIVGHFASLSFDDVSVELNFGATVRAAFAEIVATLSERRPAGTRSRGARGVASTGTTSVAVQPDSAPVRTAVSRSVRTPPPAVSDMVDVIRPLTVIDPFVDVPRPLAGQVAVVGMTAHAVGLLFAYISATVEQVERRRIRRMRSVNAFLAEFPLPSSRTLNKGLTFEEIVTAVGGDVTDSWHRSLVSFAVDVCNDVGILVPSAVYDAERHSVRRQYRIGENSGLARMASFADRQTWLTPSLRTTVIDPFAEEDIEQISAEDYRQLASVDQKIHKFFRAAR
ncbi:hypothetical protein [Nocardioides sp.]|uniref:hypothetical protein n=1 Tax=Nocardioides sp. TaxID=35761 RepID=UPI002638220B|nr:hypothetical protein [Nocardioides sp.]